MCVTFLSWEVEVSASLLYLPTLCPSDVALHPSMGTASLLGDIDLSPNFGWQTNMEAAVGYADTDGSLWSWHSARGLFQATRLGTYLHLLKCRRQWSDAHQTERNDIGWGGSPRMIPVLIGFPFVAPGLHCYGRAFSYHVHPAAVALACHQGEGGIRFA